MPHETLTPLLLSCPSVEVLSGLDALESPDVLGVDGQRVGVSSSQALGDPGVVESLSVSELEVADGTTDEGTQEDAGEGESNACVEGCGVQAGALSVVPVAESGTSEGGEEEAVAASDLNALAEIEEVNVEDVGVVLDELDGADASGELVVGLLHGVRVSVALVAMVVVTHIIYYTLIILLLYYKSLS
jgi:hypothetical protein